jgi:hypothetical protein
VPAGFPAHGHATHAPSAAATGPGPVTPESPARAPADPRVPPDPPPRNGAAEARHAFWTSDEGGRP